MHATWHGFPRPLLAILALLSVCAVDGSSAAAATPTPSAVPRRAMRSTTVPRAASWHRMVCQSGGSRIDPCSGSTSALPGATGRTVAFTIYNSGSTRFGAQHYFLVKSCSGAVTSCTLSASSVDVPDGSSARVTITYATSTTPGTGSITLEASDRDGEDVSGTISVSVVVPDATAPTVSISPASGGSYFDPSLAVTITWGDNQSLNAASRTITLNGNAVTGSFGYSGSSTSATSSGTVTLSTGTNTLTARICDVAGNCTSRSASYTRNPYPPTIAITAGARTGTTQPMTIDWSDDVGLNDASHRITFNGADVTSTFSYRQDPNDPTLKHWLSVGTVTLRAGSNTLAAHVCDVEGACTDASWSYDADIAPPSISLNPSGGLFGTTSVALAITWCDNGPLNGSSRTLTTAGGSHQQADVTSSFTYSLTGGGCATSTGTLALYPDTTTLTARICDDAGNCANESADYVRDQVAPAVSISPANNGDNTSASVQATVSWGDNYGLALTTRTVTFNGTNVLDGFPYSGSSISGTSSGTVALNAGANTLTAHICDVAGNCTSPSVSYTYNPPPTSIAVTPDNGTATALANSGGTQHFGITSTGGPASGATYSLSAACTGTAACASTDVSPRTVTIVSGHTVDATVSYSVGADRDTGTVRLTATYNVSIHDAGSVTVTAHATCDATEASLSPCVQDAGIALANATQSGDTVTILNHTGTRLFYTVDCQPSDAVTSCSATSDPGVDGNQSGAIIVTMTAGPTDGWGSARVMATTSDGEQAAATLNLEVLSPTSVVVRALNAALLHMNVHDTASRRFTVHNAGSLTAAYTIDPSCGFDIASCSASIRRDTLAAGATDTVTVSFEAGGTPGALGQVGLVATHVASAQITSTAAITVLVNDYGVALAPVQDSASVAAGAHSAAFTVRNTSTDSATFLLATPCVSPVTGCSAPASVHIDSGATATVNVAYTETAASVSGGYVGLRATLERDTTIAGEASMRIAAHSAATGGEPQVALVNSDSLAARNLCLTIAAGPSAAYECGDLRLVHALPAIRTMNRPRTPVLLYDSRFAEPHPLVAVNVRLLPDTVAPDSVAATLTLDGTPTGITVTWSGAGWVPGTTRRLVIPVDNAALTTGVHDYTLQVFNIYGAVQRPSAAVDGRFVVVNRRASPFGAGWWLAGLEQLGFPAADTTVRLWVGGDGSVRVYTKVASGVWAAPTVTRPDTLTWDGTHYTRHLAHGLRVVFDAQGHHVATINRLSDTTTFTYTADTLQTITLPPGGAGQTYTFDYTTPGQVRITAPRAGTIARVTTLMLMDGRVTSIRDPDYQAAPNPFVSFAYDGTSARINARTDKRGTTVSYIYDAGQTLDTVRIPLTATDTATSIFVAAESQGLAPAVVRADSVFTLLDGPRLDAADTTRFWLDRFGAPSKIHDALGHETVLTTDPALPGLVARLEQPNEHVLLAAYDPRGNLAAVTDSAPFGGSAMATTTYQWDPAWDFVTQITRPEGDSAAFQYDAATGNRLWQQDGRGAASRVTFRYYESGTRQGLLSATERPGGAIDSVTYDAVGNLAAIRTSLGFWTRFYKDAIGRDTLIESPIDVAGTLVQHARTVYDVSGRDSLTQTIGPAMNGAPADTLTVIQSYDAAGHRLSLSRSSSPDSAGIGAITTQWHYDLAGRVDYETAPDGKVDSTHYDAASNADSVFTRRGDVITMTYDPLNRLVTRVIPSVMYHDTIAGIATVDTLPYPRLPNSGTDYVIAAQTESFTYDALGHILTANNADARVTRTYFPNGALESERQQLRNATDTSFSHDFLLTYSYDLDGHRTAVYLPDSLVPAGTQDKIRWAYSALTGQLTDATDPLGNTFQYEYNDRNEPTSLSYPGGYSEHWGYDADGRITGDTVINLDVTVDPRWPARLARAMTLTYDARGKLLTSQDATGFQQETVSQYTGLGALATSSTWQRSELQGYPDVNIAYATGEQQSYDALGNMYSMVTVDTTWKGTNGPENTRFERNATHQPGVGRLLADSGSQGNRTYIYDPAGNLTFSMQDGTSQDAPLEDRFTYYSADGKVRAADSRTVLHPNEHHSPLIENLVFEKYRYDALGRRVWVRTYRECGEDLQGEFSAQEYKECSTSTLRRTVWDGNQELIEIQVPGDESQLPSTLENDDYKPRLQFLPIGQGNDPNPLFGRVVYTHGLDVDQPIALTRYRYVNLGQDYTDFLPQTYSLFWTPMGQLTLALCANGAVRCQQDSLAMGIDYPEAFFAYARPTFVQRTFQGTLIRDKLDAAGTVYRRNRVYDPATGRFTQEDPLGLAGGLNLYGYAAGDPVSYSDPFGLDPCKSSAAWTECIAQAIADWGAMRGGVGGAIALNAGAALNAGFEATGINTAARAGNDIGSGHIGRGLFVAALTVGGGQIGRGLRGASAGLRALFSESGGLADESLIGIRSVLKENGFTMGLADNKQGYLFTNGTGEEVRLMRGDKGWSLRVKNAAGNYLDALGNPGGRATTHLSIWNR